MASPEWDAFVKEHPDAPTPIRTTAELERRIARLEDQFRYELATEDTFETSIAKNELRPTPLSFFGRLREFVLDIDARNKWRNARLDALERRPAVAGVKYCGVFRDGESYAAGSLVTRGGGLWCATEDTTEIPGHGLTPWLLIVKRGDS